MARHPKPNYHASRKAYCVMYNGIRHNLAFSDTDDRPDGPNWIKAQAKWVEILEGRHDSPSTTTTVADVLDSYAKYLQSLSKETYHSSIKWLTDLSGVYGRLPAEEFNAALLIRAIDRKRDWMPGTRRISADKVKAAFSRAKGRGLIRRNPLADFVTPSDWVAGARGKEHVWEPDVLALVLDQLSPLIRDCLFVLSRTGARPIELCEAEHYHFHDNPPRIIFEGNATRGYRWKNARKKKRGSRNRTIYLDEEAAAIVRRNASKKGWLFPASRAPHLSVPVLRNAVKDVKDKDPVKSYLAERGIEAKHVVPMGLRHTWITNALLKKVPIYTVAMLCGTSVAMIEQHYSHAIDDTAAMYQAYLAAK